MPDKTILDGPKLNTALNEFVDVGLHRWDNRLEDSPCKKRKLVHISRYFIAPLHFLVFLMSCRYRRRQCGETAEIEGREPILTLRRASCGSPTGIHEKELFWLEECRKRVGRYDTSRMLWSMRLHGSTVAHTEWVRSKDGKDRVCNWLYNKMIWDEMMRLTMRWKIHLPRVPRIYTPCRSAHLHYPCISIHPWSPWWSQSSLYLRTPAVAQSCAKLSGGGGEIRICPPQLIPCPLCEAHLFSSIWYNCIPNPKRT